jgi:L-fucose isomerase-like protein
MKLGILPLGRPTFDVPFAQEKLDAMLAVLDESAHQIIGPRELLMEASAQALDDVAQADLILVLQVTFTDATFIVEASKLGVPMAIWAVPEPRLGGRLRLNAFCGLNLASHALGRNGIAFDWLYADPTDATVAVDLKAALTGQTQGAPTNGTPPDMAPAALPIDGLKIARIGAHPDGFDTCAYDKPALKALTGADVDELELADMFDVARGLDEDKIAPYREKAARLPNLKEMDAGELDRSLRLAGALEHLKTSGGYDAFAIRCWPETFTEYGGAVCGPVSMMGEARVPCACEADVYGAVTQAILQKVADAPVFLADLVDMDLDDDTGVVWHCGQAPVSMTEAEPRATVHTNRKQALLYEFPLKPGRVTFFRLSQALGAPKIILASGEMLARDMAFTGTSGVVKFDHGAKAVLQDVIASGLEHHMALTYGDHMDALKAIAAGMELPVVELGAR